MVLSKEEVAQVLHLVNPYIGERLAWVIPLLKAVGVIMVIYIMYLIFMAVVNFRRAGRLKRVEKKVDIINRRLDELISRRGKVKKGKGKRKK